MNISVFTPKSDCPAYGQVVASVEATESRITFTFESGALLAFVAESQCCDCSWFVLSDIDEPADFKGAVVFDVRVIEPSYEYAKAIYGDSQVSYAAEVVTSRGVYHARMANDGGDSGCYSGELNCSYWESAAAHNADERHDSRYNMRLMVIAKELP